MKIGFFQFSPILGRKDANIEKAISSIRGVSRLNAGSASGGQADLLVLPELFGTGYLFENKEELERSAEIIPQGPTFSKMAELSAQKRVNFVFGMAEREGDKLFNSSVLVTPKGDFSVYRKLHLFDREKLWFSPGDKELEVIDIGEAKVGMMICFDWIFPEVARILALKGAEIICHPSDLILGYCQNAMITRCVENGVFAITANRTGTEGKGETKLTFTGNSQIVDPKGNILTQADDTQEGVWTVEINPASARDKRFAPNNHLFEDRRTEFYKKGNLC